MITISKIRHLFEQFGPLLIGSVLEEFLRMDTSVKHVPFDMSENDSRMVGAVSRALIESFSASYHHMAYYLNNIVSKHISHEGKARSLQFLMMIISQVTL